MYLRRKEIVSIIFRYFVEIPAKNQPLLDYFRERMQRATTLHGLLILLMLVDIDVRVRVVFVWEDAGVP